MRHSPMHRLQCFIEPLEQRALLSVSLNAGVLTVTGTGGADRIEVQKRADKGQVNGSERGFALSSVHKIVISSLGGNDFIEYSGRDGGLSIPSSINAGDGN